MYFAVYENACNQIAVYSIFHPSAGAEFFDTCISNSTTFVPIYHSASNPNSDFVLHYGDKVTGFYLDKKTGKRSTIDDPAKGPLVDDHFLSQYLTTLPLTSGYKKDIDVYAYLPGNATNVKKFHILEVVTSSYTSQLTGMHPIWQVMMSMEGSSNSYIYYIDKNTRRVWKLEMKLNGQNLTAVNTESDYNPYKTKLDKEAALKMITDGSATIDGQAFARDHHAAIKGIAVLNVNKKQCAPAGTSVVLIPYTDFFKEWFSLNDAARKKGRSIPMPKEAAACIKTTTIYDNDGHFEFTNLEPGDYMLLTEFGYVHSAQKTEITGYTDSYIDGAYVGSNPTTNTYSYNTGASASVKKIVTVKQAGEKITIKLKETL